MSGIKNNVLEIITELTNVKKGKIEPDMITLTELIKEIKSALNELYKDGKIEVGDTINDKYIGIK